MSKFLVLIHCIPRPPRSLGFEISSLFEVVDLSMSGSCTQQEILLISFQLFNDIFGKFQEVHSMIGDTIQGGANMSGSPNNSKEACFLTR